MTLPEVNESEFKEWVATLAAKEELIRQQDEADTEEEMRRQKQEEDAFVRRRRMLATLFLALALGFLAIGVLANSIAFYWAIILLVSAVGALILPPISVPINVASQQISRAQGKTEEERRKIEKQNEIRKQYYQMLGLRDHIRKK